MEITIKFQPVADGLPPVDPFPNYQGRYSIECIGVVKGEVFDRSIMFDFQTESWVWADMALGEDHRYYEEELGGNTPTVTAWAPWPVLVPSEVAQKQPA
jgi:hypothetical protein